MSLPLRDFRVGLPEDVMIALEAEAQGFDIDMQAVARQVLQEWAQRRAHAAMVHHRLARSNGTGAAVGGPEMGDDGLARKFGRVRT